MGAWGDGLYDNDEVLDDLGHLLADDELELSKDPAHLAAGIGLLLWLNPPGPPEPAAEDEEDDGFDAPDITRYAALVRDHEEWLTKLTPDAAAMLRSLADDPAEMTRRPGSRTEQARAILGGYSDGHRIDALLDVPGGEAVIARLADRCRDRLDEAFQNSESLDELSGKLAPLGALIELHEIGVKPSAGMVKRWKDSFARCDRKTGEQRSFWDGYVRRVAPALGVFEAATATELEAPEPQSGSGQTSKSASSGFAGLLGRMFGKRDP